MKESSIDMLDMAEDSMRNVWKSSTNTIVKEWFELLRFYTEAWDIPASTEAARRHYSTKTFGSPNVGWSNCPALISNFGIILLALDSVVNKDGYLSLGDILIIL